MTGDFTSVPLQPDGPAWLGARMQQGRVLLDGDWNLNVDATDSERQHLARATIGAAGVLSGSSAFEVSFAGNGAMQIGAGTMWVGGLRAVNAQQLDYTDQEAIGALPPSGNALVYLDAVVQEVQPAEDPGELLDQALDGVDTVTRTRVAWRVRAVATAATSCSAGVADLPAGLGTGRLDVVRTTPALPADPCAPPDDPRGTLPDGLLRVEVLDSGDASTARFAWSYENGSAAVAATVSGTQATLVPSPSTTFFPNDLVEVSTLVRRLDRLDNGPLFTADAVTPGAGGSVVTLSSPASVTGTPSGLSLRRWDGEVVGAASQVTATLAGTDIGVAFTAHPGSYLAGDWWAVQVRGSAGDAVQTVTNRAPDGVEHHVAALAVVDLATHQVLSDCRPTFVPLTELDRGSTCTVSAFPGDDLQAAADALPATGGKLCLAAGRYTLTSPVVITGKQRVVVSGVGPATVLAVTGHESVLQLVDCTDVTVERLRAEAGTAGDVAGRVGEEHLLGAVSFLGCDGVVARDCDLVCPDNTGRTQAGFYSAPSGQRDNSRNRVLGNRVLAGDQQIGVLVVSCDDVKVADNDVRLGPSPRKPRRKMLPFVVREVARFMGSHVAETASETVAMRATVDAPAAVAAGARIDLPSGTSFTVAGPPQVQRLAKQLGALATESSVRRLTARQALEKFVRRAVQAPQSVALSRANERFFAAIRGTRALGQGIVVGGTRAALVRLHGNVVSDVIEGLHVGLGGADGQTATAGDVSICDNVVHCTVPYFWNRSRHAIFSGSVDRLTVHDNTASLLRIGGAATDVAAFTPTPVEAARIYGRIGPWLSVRGLSLTGAFACGVRVTDTSTSDAKATLRYVSDVLNSAATGPALQPVPFPYAHDRCAP